MNDVSSFFKCSQDFDKALSETNTLNKTTVFDALAQAGVTSVTVEFDGEGDSGQIESVIATRGDERTELPKTPVTVLRSRWQGQSDTVQTPLEEAVSDLCYGYLSQEHGGWENNDGAFGTFILDVAARTIELEFNGRFSETFTTNHNF